MSVRRPVLTVTLVSLCALVGVLVLSAAALASVTQFGTEGEGAGQFNEPGGVAVEQVSGDVYVVDGNNNRVEKFGDEGEFMLGWGWGVANGAVEPQTCGPDAVSLIASCQTGDEGTGSGQLSTQEAPPGAGIAVDNDQSSFSHGDVYVTDSRDNRVEEFGPEGDFILMFGGEVNKASGAANPDVCTAASGDVCGEGVEGAGDGQFERPEAIAVGSAGNVYVGGENRVQEFSAEGVYEAQVTLPNSGRIEALAVAAGGNLYVRSNELTGVREYAACTGTCVGTELGQPRDESGAPTAIAIGPSGELFVSDDVESNGFMHHVLKYGPSDEEVASFDARTTEHPSHGVAFGEGTEKLYITSPNHVALVSAPPAGPVAPIVVAGSETATEVQQTTATVNATVNPEGHETTYRFEYGTSESYGASTPSAALPEGFEDQPVSADLTNLALRSTYHFRVVAESTVEGKVLVTDGPDETFVTLPAVSIDSESVTQVTSTSARLAAELNPLGLPTEYSFEYGLSTAYGSSAPIPDASAGSGTGDIPVSILTEGLQPGSTYHYRVVAHNSLGTVEGSDHTFVTQGGVASTLPDGRAWEMVSPVNKHGVSLEAISEEGSDIQAAEDGGAISYIAKGAIDAEPAGNRSVANSQLLSTRGPGGWSTQDITTPHQDVSGIQPGFPSEYQLFSTDLSVGVVESEGATPLSSQTTERTPYLRQLSGEYVPLVTAANVLTGAKFGGHEIKPEVFEDGVSFKAGSPDLSHVVLESPEALTEPTFTSGGLASLYEWAGGSLKLVSVLPNGKPAAEEGLPSSVGGDFDVDVRNAVSKDGDRIVFETPSGHGHLYLRDVGKEETVQIDAQERGRERSEIKPEFQIANSEGTKVFFTDTARLTAGSTATSDSPDLYMCELSVSADRLGCVLKDLTVDHHANERADVQGNVIGASENGSQVYFVANGVLASGAAPGACSTVESTSGVFQPGVTCNLYGYDTATGETRLVALLSSADFPDWEAATGSLSSARVSPDGEYLAFMSQRSLTGYDNLDARSGQPDEEVFVYDANTETLRCTSCDPTGARPVGIFDPNSFPGLLVDRTHTWGNHWLAGSIPGWTHVTNHKALYQSRYLSDNGRLFFDSPDALAPQDTNGKEDVYEYEPSGIGTCDPAPGCVSLISSGTSNEESAFLDASNEGENAFILTAAKLSPSDVDSALDVYDAHVCSSSSPCPAATVSVPPACSTTDSCRAASPPQPEVFASPASAMFSNPAIQAVSPAITVKQKAKPLTRAQKLAAAVKRCKKRPKKKRPACVKQAHRRYGSANETVNSSRKGTR
jgi:hypothetical protein